MENIRDGVHATHCCSHHGCKYGAEDCPVEQGRIPALYECEFCTFPSRDTGALEQWSEQDRVRLAREQVDVIVDNTVGVIALWLDREQVRWARAATRYGQRGRFIKRMQCQVRALLCWELARLIREGAWKA